MKTFLGHDFLLETETAKKLYFDHAERQPIFDFHCHLSPKAIAENATYSNLSEIWLAGDHYKWRAMRTNGVREEKITGSASDREKFQAWAETVPYCIGNPLYHWTHMELRKPFGIETVLNGESAESVWNRANELLATPEFSVRGLLRMFDVRVVGTTDDPADPLTWHRKIADDSSIDTRVVPTFRPDKLFATDDVETWNRYVDRVAETADRDIAGYDDLLDALEKRMDDFHAIGGRASDHGLRSVFASFCSREEAARHFERLRGGTGVSVEQGKEFSTMLLLDLNHGYARRGWVSQYHLGAMRNNNTRMYRRLGPDTGFDSMADEPLAADLAAFLDALDRDEALPKTVLYTNNPVYNEVMATMIGNFQDGSVPGKLQFGSGWWFNDQIDGMERQMTALANMGLLRRFVGMLTDSRSFLSFPRHDYFRRILCNMIGNWVESGQVPNDEQLTGAMVREICWGNAKEYFQIEV